MRTNCLGIALLPLLTAGHVFGGTPVPLPSASTVDGGGGAGFTEAVFDAALLQSLLDEKECAGIRFYNIMLEPTSPGTVMAIGIRGDKSEINGGLFASPYKVSTSSALSRNNAAEACGNMRTAGNTSYSASFTKEEILALLKVVGCTALRITPTDEKGTPSMRIAAVSLEEGRANELGSGDGFERSCGDPCPTICGPPQQYINANK